MSIIFDGLINSFLENEVGVVENFLSETLATQLRENLLRLHATEQLRVAGIGNNAKLVRNDSIRKDKIYWLDRKHGDLPEDSFFDLMDSFVLFLNSTCYTGITGYEFHYALYEKGSYYRRHLDQFKDNSSRVYSMIMYLNLNWQEQDGGQLCIFHPHHTQFINPTNGKCVFFKSSALEHEVLLSHAPRMSITGWLKL